MKGNAKWVVQLLCCVNAGLLTSCVSTDELYAEYDAANCKLVIEKAADGTQMVRDLYSYTLHKWQPVVFFDSDSSGLTEKTVGRLHIALNVLEQLPSAKLALQGFADHHGAVDYNLRLARRRVDAVRQWLIDNGIEQNRISFRAMGEGLQAFSDDDATARGNNRRVELMLLDDQGLPVVQMYDLQDD